MELRFPASGADPKRAQAEQDRATRLQLPHPRRTTQILLLALSAGICDQTYCQYRNLDHYWPTYWLPYVHGTGLAPEQYRIAVKFAAWWLVRHLHWGFRHGFALMDAIGIVMAVLLTFNLLEKRLAFREASIPMQWFAAAVLLALTAYYLEWVGFFFRPETLPSVGLTLLLVWLWTAPPKGSFERHAVTICALILVSAAQAWIRADIPCALNAGIFLISITRFGRDLPLPKRSAIVTSLVCTAIALGTQLYIMRVMYPHAGYGPIPVFMFRHDLRWLNLPPFLVFMLPVAWTGLQAWRQRASLDGPGLGVLLGATIYLFLWILMGKIEEVRIFIPFALALSPLTAEFALHRIQPTRNLPVATFAEGEVRG
jgi:hypothetical protein